MSKKQLHARQGRGGLIRGRGMPVTPPEAKGLRLSSMHTGTVIELVHGLCTSTPTCCWCLTVWLLVWLGVARRIALDSEFKTSARSP